MIQRIRIDEFIELSENCLIIDVRSPAEYDHAHFPGAYNIPLFNNDERKTVGTAYKQKSREDAIKIGLDFFGPKMRKIVEEVENLFLHRSVISQSRIISIYCWRGGMRSAGVAWLLDLYGFKVYTLAGGYKSFRNWTIKQFQHPYSFKILGGYTGSGKTTLLQKLKQTGATVLDLENLAKHKGSAFGGFDEKQPSQEMFENLTAIQLRLVSKKTNETIWLEDESQRIGLVNIPKTLWENMRNSPISFINIPFNERLNNIVYEYGKYPIEILIEATLRIEKRLGGLDTKNVIRFLKEGNLAAAFEILLRYYDKQYERGLNNRENIGLLLKTIKCEKVDENNIQLLNLNED